MTRLFIDYISFITDLFGKIISFYCKHCYNATSAKTFILKSWKYFTIISAYEKINLFKIQFIFRMYS